MKPKRERILPTWDDGRTVASMAGLKSPSHARAHPAAAPSAAPPPEPLSRRALVRYTLSAVGAGLLIAIAFCACGALFIAFCVHVWLR
jgi:hypothetical protein